MLRTGAPALPAPWRSLGVALGRRGRVVVALLAGALLLFGGWLWVRQSSLVAITRVTITGARGPAAPEIEHALSASARTMTTLAVDARRLRAAVAAIPEVSALRVHASFPHALTIDVIEHAPVAQIVFGNEHVAVRGDGTLLSGTAAAGLPSVAMAAGPTGGDRVSDPAALAALQVLAGAPYVLRSRIIDAIPDPHGVRVELRQGPELVFGLPAQIAAKWAAALRVLADPAASGAIYVDLRLPQRPAAGGRGSESGLSATSLDPNASAGTASASPSAASAAAGPG
ncbi:MAG: cell division protein FtsQ/DivIB [Solirubrobacteraceae bacterium]